MFEAPNTSGCCYQVSRLFASSAWWSVRTTPSTTAKMGARGVSGSTTYAVRVVADVGLVDSCQPRNVGDKESRYGAAANDAVMMPSRRASCSLALCSHSGSPDGSQDAGAGATEQRTLGGAWCMHRRGRAHACRRAPGYRRAVCGPAPSRPCLGGATPPPVPPGARPRWPSVT